MPGLAPDPWLRTVTHPLPVPGVRGVCGPSTIVYNRSTSRRERRATRGASGPVRRWRERRGPALPSRLCRCLPGVTRSGSMRLSLRRGKKPEIFARIPGNSFLFCTAVCRWLGFIDCVCSGQKALAPMRPAAASARSHLATRGQESSLLSGYQRDRGEGGGKGLGCQRSRQTHLGPRAPAGPSHRKRSNGTLTCGEKETPLTWSGGDAGTAESWSL